MGKKKLLWLIAISSLVLIVWGCGKKDNVGDDFSVDSVQQMDNLVVENGKVDVYKTSQYLKDDQKFFQKLCEIKDLKDSEIRNWLDMYWWWEKFQEYDHNKLKKEFWCDNVVNLIEKLVWERIVQRLSSNNSESKWCEDNIKKIESVNSKLKWSSIEDSLKWLKEQCNGQKATDNRKNEIKQKIKESDVNYLYKNLFSGNLINDEVRSEIQNWFSSNNIDFSNCNLPGGWSWTNIKDLLSKSNTCMTDKISYYKKWVTNKLLCFGYIVQYPTAIELDVRSNIKNCISSF